MNDRSKAAQTLAPWKILIADDDPDVHAATRLALRGIEFRGRRLSFVDAYSGAETLTALQENPDTAIVFLDAIMETEDAGLSAAKRIRESGFGLVRIIVRTGFPGQAPECQVIVDYDIHDYKEKTGLTVQKLFTSVISALRAYADLVALEGHRRGLMCVIESVSWFDFVAVQRYVAGMLAEFSDLADLDAESILVVSRSTAIPAQAPTVMASLDYWEDTGEPRRMESLPGEVTELVTASLDQRQGLSGRPGQTLFMANHNIDLVVFASGNDPFALADIVLLEVFLAKVCQAISSQQAFADIQRDRDAVLWGVALHAERWNENAQEELTRLSRLVSAIAIRLNTTLTFPNEIDSHFVRDMAAAACLHDLGNEAIPEVLLSKTSQYTAEEKILMHSHVTAGIEILKQFLMGAASSNVLNIARDIVAGHHERYDGAGYPHGLRGDAIPLAARLVAVADAYIAMTSRRPHRPAIDASVACAAIRAGKGSAYDPRIVEAFFEAVDTASDNAP